MVNAMHICSSVTRYNIVHFAEITVGYIQTAVTVFESAGVAQLTVAISVPPQADPIDTSFSLLVNTNDGTAAAAGLLPLLCLEIDLLPIHTSLPLLTVERQKISARESQRFGIRVGLEISVQSNRDLRTKCKVCLARSQ